MIVTKFMKRLNVPLGKRRSAVIVYRWLFGFVAATVAVVVLVGASAGDTRGMGSRASRDEGDKTCSGGSIASGVYENLKIADSLTDATRIPFAEIPALPRSTAIGHAGQVLNLHIR